jgi:ABC-type enterochelin transport system permease subunit
MTQSPLWSLVRAGLLIGLIFSPIAALMAFLITYEEYRHHFPDRAPAVRHATHMAVLTLIAFLVLGVIAGVLVGHER